ncbi:MAG: CYTH domain-containing protein [Phenylobacterium sp.]|jgi:adenylate cyclase
MGREIERKFKVEGRAWAEGASAETLRQGYIDTAAREVSVRVRTAAGRGWITLKSGLGLVRAEFEYEIPLEDANRLLTDFCRDGQISKRRYTVDVDGKAWVIDEFDGDLAGLVLAEVELDSPDEGVTLPSWAGAEVTGERAYSNEALSRRRNPATSGSD